MPAADCSIHFACLWGKNLGLAQSGRDEIAQLDRVVHETSDALAEIRRKELAILDKLKKSVRLPTVATKDFLSLRSQASKQGLAFYFVVILLIAPLLAER